MLPVYKPLTEAEVLQVHDAALQVLEKTGVFLSHPVAQSKLSDLGAKVSDDKKRVFLPREMVEKVFATVPRSFLCAGRTSEYDLNMRQGNTYVRQVGGPISLYDMVNSTEKPLTLQDNINAARLIDALPNVHITSAMTPQDINPKTYDIAVIKALLENTRKHFWGLTVHSSHLKFEMEMLVAEAGSKEALRKRPRMTGIFCVIDPLRYPDDEIDRLLIYGEYGVPVKVPVTSLCGGNAPYTKAGTLTQMVAEFLSAAVIVEALCPGTGQWFYPLLQVLDMKTGRSVANSPELILLYAAAAQMAAYYKIPSTYSAGTLTDTQSHQAMFHLGLNLFMASLMQITEIGAAGSIQAASFYSHHSVVLIDEVINFNKKFNEGLNINEDTLAVQDIDNMAVKGDFVSSRHTLKYLRQETRFQPTIMDFRNLHPWQEDPTTIIERAAAKADDIIKNHEVPPLPSDTIKELEKIMAAAEKELN